MEVKCLLLYDVESDGDLDLYIAKCRQGVNDNTDSRRINRLYVNNGDGTFYEDATERGIAIGWQSWTADFNDINNDGFLDLFITNHDAPSQLLLNDGTGHFTEVENTGIDIVGLPIQGVMRDFDNDGMIDILVAGSKGQLFMNNGDLTFTEVDIPAFGDGMESFALGDLNNDGAVDIYGGYAIPFNNPSSEPDKVFINTTTENKFLAIELEGLVSNKNAIGARVEIYGDWGIQIREVRSGESYGISNSFTQYFGVGQAEMVDSVVVLWPSGLRQVEENVQANSKIKLIEGGCLGQTPQLMLVGETTFCPGDSLVISIDGDFSEYQWSNGNTGNEIVIKESGQYSVIATDSSGCLGFSEKIRVVVDPELFPSLSLDKDVDICEGESIVISTEDQNAVWNTGDTTQEITVTETGDYFVSVQGLCREFVSSSVNIEVLSIPSIPVVEDITIQDGDNAMLSAEGDNVYWYESDISSAPIAQGNDAVFENILSDTIFYAASVNGSPSEPASVGMIDHSGSSYSGIPASNFLIFDAFKPFTLKSAKFYTDTPGDRIMRVLDSNFDIVVEKKIFVKEGEHYADINVDIPQGKDMVFTFDAQFNIENYGSQDPRLQRSSNNVDYPYVIEDVVSLKNSNYGGQYYYYYYDLQIETITDACASERADLNVTLEALSTSDFGVKYNVYPNPTQDHFVIDLPQEEGEYSIKMYSQDGKLVINQKNLRGNTSHDIQKLVAGKYSLEIITKKGTLTESLIVTSK